MSNHEEKVRSASAEGEQAFREGKPVSDCPYPRTKTQGRGEYWLQGWWHAYSIANASSIRE